VTGGQKWAQSNGFYVEPTVIEDVTPEMTVVKEEVSARTAAATATTARFVGWGAC
jgi:acyl-CoA reductase-like NAD-dependent aldehyde dehydrogenase